MIYPRLKLARNLLRDDGVIFISIDDHEQANLKRLCDEVFGEENFVGNIIWEKRYGRSNNAKLMTTSTEHILLYRKSGVLSVLREARTKNHEDGYSNPDNDSRGIWTSVSFVNQVTREARPNLSYTITNPNTGEQINHPTNAWKVSFEKYELLQKENRLHWGADGKAKYPRIKRFLSELDEGIVPVNFWKAQDVGTGDNGTKEIQDLMGIDAFTFPKPTLLVKKMLSFFVSSKQDNDIILDFFSGSATTAHAVMALNAEDGGNRKFIMVQLPEACDDKSEAFKAGYKTIAEIGKERIRRAGKKIVDSGKKIVDSREWDSISKKEKSRYGCKELSRTDCVAESDGAGQGSLFNSQKTAEGGTVQSFESDASSRSIHPVQYSGGAGTELHQRVSPIFSDSKGLSSGAGNTTPALHKSAIPCRYGYFGSDFTPAGDSKDAFCSYQNTVHCPLTTVHSPLPTVHSLDIGFRVLKIDTSNMQDVYYTPDALKQSDLLGHVDHIRSDRSGEDLLFQVLLDWGVDLSLPITQETILGKTVFFVDGNALAACFDSGIGEDVVKELAKRQPLRVVFRDSSFESDSIKINVEQIFKLLSPHTEIKGV